MKGFCSLASGSKGNCLYLASDHTKILIDAGISYKQIEERLQMIGVALEEIDAILITHEHIDHIYGIKTLLKNRSVPLITNSETAKGIYAFLQFVPDFKIFTTNEPFVYQDLHIFPFSIQHDTLDPVGFVITIDGIKIGIGTDMGYVTSLVQNHLKECQYLYIEANHQVSMVHASPRPQAYKDRVLSRQGHLSNEECARLLVSIDHPAIKHVLLAHLSRECNSAEAALHAIQKVFARKIPISVAQQDRPSDFIPFQK